MNIKLVALNIADSIDVKVLKNSFQGKLIKSTSTELFYKTDDNKYISIFNYGVVAFSDASPEEIESTITLLNDYTRKEQERISETIEIQFKEAPSGS